jgi:hypothetical protein
LIAGAMGMPRIVFAVGFWESSPGAPGVTGIGGFAAAGGTGFVPTAGEGPGNLGGG